MVVFDSAFLSLLIWPQAKPPLDPTTNQLVAHCKERIELLVQALQKDKHTILIPTPVLSEVLTIADLSALQYVTIIQKSSVSRIEAFDTRAAIELAQMNK